MKNKRRQPREELDKQEFSLLKPIDVLSLGSINDPCFGILHDLMASECKSCGDSDFCSIVKAQNLNKERIEIENTQRFKDIEESDIEISKDVNRLILKYKDRGLKRLKIILKVSKELGIDKSKVKTIYEKL